MQNKSNKSASAISHKVKTLTGCLYMKKFQRYEVGMEGG